MSRRSFRVPPVTGAALAAALFSAACSGTRTSAAAPSEPAPVAIQVAHVRAEPVDRFLRVTGSIVADERADVAAEAAGRVIGTPVERGTRVAAGAALVRISATEAEASLREAEANAAQLEARLGLGAGQAFDPARVPEVLNAKASLDWSEADFARIRALLDQKVVSQAEYDQRLTQVQAARQQYQVAQNAAQQSFRSLQAARARVDLARKSAADTVVRAPFSGIVAERAVSTGDYVSRGTKVATVVRIDPVRVELTVPEQHLSQVKTGQAVRLSVDA
jgi:multidrug resistance efflux pump